MLNKLLNSYSVKLLKETIKWSAYKISSACARQTTSLAQVYRGYTTRRSTNDNSDYFWGVDLLFMK